MLTDRMIIKKPKRGSFIECDKIIKKFIKEYPTQWEGFNKWMDEFRATRNNPDAKGKHTQHICHFPCTPIGHNVMDDIEQIFPKILEPKNLFKLLQRWPQFQVPANLSLKDLEVE